MRRLKFIRAAQAAGFTLEEIGELLALDAGHDHARARALAKDRIRALDARIAELEKARDALKRLARDCARSHGPCPIIKAFEREGQGSPARSGNVDGSSVYSHIVPTGLIT